MGWSWADLCDTPEDVVNDLKALLQAEADAQPKPPNKP